MVKDTKVLLEPCPFCRGEVELWKYQEAIRCRFICKECKVEIEFPKGLDSKTCIKKWNRRGTQKSITVGSSNDILYPKGASILDILNTPYAEEEGLSETIRMDEGPDQFKTIYYEPTCPHGYEDCIHDPAYIKATYPKWYSELFGDAEPADVACSTGPEGYCKKGERYDDEDK